MMPGGVCGAALWFAVGYALWPVVLLAVACDPGFRAMFAEQLREELRWLLTSR